MPETNVTEQIAHLMGGEYPLPLTPPAIKSPQKALPGYQTRCRRCRLSIIERRRPNHIYSYIRAG